MQFWECEPHVSGGQWSALIVSSIVSVIALVTTHWCHGGPAPPPGDVTLTARPLQRTSVTPTPAMTRGRGQNTCHTVTPVQQNWFGIILFHGRIFSCWGRVFTALSTSDTLASTSPHTSPRCNDNGTKAFQKPLLSGSPADSSPGYLSIIVLIPGEWSMAGNGCILSWPGIVAVITQQVGPSAAPNVTQERRLPRGEQRHSVTLSRFRTCDVVSVVSKPGTIILPAMWRRPPQHRDILPVVTTSISPWWGRDTANTGGLKRKFGQIPLTIVSFTWWRGHRHKRGIC